MILCTVNFFIPTISINILKFILYTDKFFPKLNISRKSRSPTSKGRNVVINNTGNHRSPSISPSRKHSLSPSRRSYGGSSDDQVNNNSATGTTVLQ